MLLSPFGLEAGLLSWGACVIMLTGRATLHVPTTLNRHSDILQSTVRVLALSKLKSGVDVVWFAMLLSPFGLEAGLLSWGACVIMLTGRATLHVPTTLNRHSDILQSTVRVLALSKLKCEQSRLHVSCYFATIELCR
jgi:hypothetical protein